MKELPLLFMDMWNDFYDIGKLCYFFAVSLLFLSHICIKFPYASMCFCAKIKTCENSTEGKKDVSVILSGMDCF